MEREREDLAVRRHCMLERLCTAYPGEQPAVTMRAEHARAFDARVRKQHTTLAKRTGCNQMPLVRSCSKASTAYCHKATRRASYLVLCD
eukprot:266386-Pleurochrysis_carterae.AAC.1